MRMTLKIGRYGTSSFEVSNLDKIPHCSGSELLNVAPVWPHLSVPTAWSLCGSAFTSEGLENSRAGCYFLFFFSH